jgi:hypothetical protein
MTAAVALAVVLVIAVAGMSLAMQTQRPVPPGASRVPTPPRRTRERRAATPEPVVAPESKDPEGSRGPELLRSGTPAEAKVVSVIDERTLGPVTRSRLQLDVRPSDTGPFEVTLRVAFPTPEARARVRVGGTVPVRYDPADHSRVILDLDRPPDPPSPAQDPSAPAG